MTTLNVTGPEHAAIMAGLRLLQHLLLTEDDLPAGIDDILYPADKAYPQLHIAPRGSEDDIDRLCQKINSQGR